MECVQPILSNTKSHGRLFLPCGKCIPCKQRKGREWFIRLTHQYEKSVNPSFFVTLTYNDDNLAKEPEKELLQKLIKQVRNISLRKHLPGKLKFKNPVFFDVTPIKHFTIAEKGDLHNRLHYHIMFFNVNMNKLTFHQLIDRLWDRGFITCDEVTPARVCYITDYMVTKMDEKTVWRNMSLGLGSSYLVDQVKKKHYKSLDTHVVVNNQNYPMPRYYRNKIFDKTKRQLVGKKLYGLSQEKSSIETRDDRYQELLRKVNYKIQKRKLNKFNKLRKNGKQTLYNSQDD